METNKEKGIAYEKDNRCIYCGEIIPEGIQVCKVCEYELIRAWATMTEPIIKRRKDTEDDRVLGVFLKYSNSRMRT